MAGEVQKVNVGNVNNYIRTLSPEEVKKRQENEKFFEKVKGQMKDAGFTLEHAEDKGLNKESQKLLTTYGLEKEAAEWVGIDNVQVEEKNGVKKLVLTSGTDNYKLSINIDENFDPEKVYMFRAEDDANVHFEGINGEFEILGAYENGFGDDSVGFAFKNCDIKIKCADGVKDYIAIEDGTKAEITTGDYADTVDMRDKYKLLGEHKEQRLKPGTQTFNNNNIPEQYK